jgi:hypothetical protein
VRLRALLVLVSTAALVAALASQGGTASAGGQACGLDVAGNGGYTYAGHQASHSGHGVRATIIATRALAVQAGHVSGWVGVGGPGQGANGEDAWIQVGIAGMHGMEPFLYAEVTRGGRYPQFILLENGVQVGQSRSVAVLEMSGRAGWWRVWVNGNPVTKPIHIRGSSGRWAPIATAESWNGGERACNRFAYRFERVLVSHGRGGSWQPFVSAHRFLDGGYTLTALATAPAQSRQLSAFTRAPAPYAFIASS